MPTSIARLAMPPSARGTMLPKLRLQPDSSAAGFVHHASATGNLTMPNFMPKPRTGNRHRPGYRAPSEGALENYNVQLRHETVAAWKEAVARAGMSQRQAAEQMFCAFAREHGVDAPTPPARRNNGSKPPPLDC